MLLSRWHVWASNTNFIVFGLTRPKLELKIYQTWGEHAYHYTTDEVISYIFAGYIRMKCEEYWQRNEMLIFDIFVRNIFSINVLHFFVYLLEDELKLTLISNEILDRPKGLFSTLLMEISPSDCSHWNLYCVNFTTKLTIWEFVTRNTINYISVLGPHWHFFIFYFSHFNM
jgi:hypothetical protein